MGREAWWATVYKGHRVGQYWSDFSSVQFSRSVVSNSLWPHEQRNARPPCPSPTPGVYPNPCPSSQWYHPTISSSVVPFSCPQSFPASWSFQMSQLFTSGGQSIGVSASTSVLSMDNQCWVQLDEQGFQKCHTAREWEMRHKNSEKSKDQGTNTAPRWRSWNWIQASFIILSAVNERISRELKL